MAYEGWRIALIAALGVGACQQSSGGTSRPASPRTEAALQDVVAQGAAYAQHGLGFRNPVLTYVLLACFDSYGRLDPGLEDCPGTMIATFAERDQPTGELAFLVLGREGLAGQRTAYGTVISLDPPRCTPSQVLAVAQTKGIHWDRVVTTMLAYAPQSSGPPAWLLKQKDAVLLELSDADCISRTAL
jgi:hypothetical protein